MQPPVPLAYQLLMSGSQFCKSMNLTSRLLSAAALFTGLALAGHANGDANNVVHYTNPASFAAATNGDTTYTFSGAPAGAGTDYGPVFTEGPATFTANIDTPGDLTIYNDGGYSVQYLAYTTGGTERTSELDITLTGTATAVSFDLGTFTGAQTLFIYVNSPWTYRYPLYETGKAPTTGFLGFTSTTPFNAFEIMNYSNPGNEIDVTDFTLGNNNSVVPEPSTWTAMFGGVLLLIGAAYRRRRTA